MWKKIKALLFYNRTVRQTIAKNTFWLAVSNVGGRLLRSVIIIYSARVLGASEWGVFSYAVSLVAFITVFTDFGINSILVRETAKAREDDIGQHKILSTSFILKSGLLTLGVLAVLVIAPLVSAINIKPILAIVVLILIFDSLREFGFSLIRAFEKMELEAGLYLLTNLAIVIFGLIFLAISKTVRSFTFSYALGTAAGMLATFVALRKKLKGLLSGFSVKYLKSIIASAWPFAVSSLLAVLMLNTDIIIIGLLKGAEDVGLYSAAQRIVQLLYILPSILNTSLLPTFSRLASKDNAKMRRVLEAAVTFVFLVAIPIAIGGFILGKNIISFVFGNGYVQASLAFQILILTLLIDFPVVILSGAIFAFDRQRNLIIYSAIGGISNVVFDLIFIPRWGIAGSSLATLLAQFLSTRYLWWITKKTGNFKILPHLKRVFTATAIMAALSLVLQAAGVHVLVVIMAAIAVYCGLLFALKEPLIKEIKLILQPSASTSREIGELPA